jgi:hypothetical protein
MTMTREQIQAKMRLLNLEKKRLRVLSRLVILDGRIEETLPLARGDEQRSTEPAEGGRP